MILFPLFLVLTFVFLMAGRYGTATLMLVLSGLVIFL